MSKKNLFLKSALAISITAGLAACGGGGGGESTPPPSGNEANTGKFVDSPVGGLEYTAQPSGIADVTKDDGTFRYEDGDTIKFRVGAFYLGEANGGSLITPITLTNNTPERTENIARFLQTLDDDGIPGNGITITANTRKVAANQNATDVATATITNDTVGTTTATVLTSENTVPQTTVVSAQDANDHLNGTLDQLDPVESCSDERADAVTETRLVDKAFGFIRSDELGVYHFKSDGTLADYSYDTQRTDNLRDGDSESWELLSEGSSIKFGRETSAMTVCSTANYIIFENGEGTAKLYDIKPYTLPSSTQSFVIGTAAGNQKAILEVSPDGSLDYFPAETPVSAASAASVGTFGELNLDFDEGDVIDKIYFLAGQGNRTGVYLDYNESGVLSTVGTAKMIAKASSVTEEALKGSTLVFRDEEENEVVILRLNADDTLEDFANDCYFGSIQTACYSKGTWTLSGNELTFDSSDEAPDVFRVQNAGSDIYLARSGVEGDDLFRMQKTKAIVETAFTGTYNVNIPTENTANNELVIREGSDCTYSGTQCTWEIDGNGKVEINFAFDSTATGNIWQLAGSNDKFAFVMTHSNEVNDIEPGFMTRK